ncbi:hypothetical protein [Pseudobacteriovorax antillogorgiicola]|uniref:Lipoprotein n=1 Tax=Pseudobacteriovorax antillogorgiicola TaxID=1513793 RepID=A0A1Y6CAI9_9BACT|nr:hypothetical protein [Pseudobacteriovorax antillogorgiicola]TCS49078.1 hypothetical protein EDD56_116121 [Pseudobacteriovorax antillogorgiicola]SMF52058.1 hypothetical protein SAMN06296036_11633 [Pseudobacteriovorax antillogorgiicola]
MKLSSKYGIRASSIGLVLGASLVMGGCGAEDDDDSTETTASTSVSSLNSIPDVSTLLVNTSSSLALQGSADAVVGTPPAFSTISGDNLETYLIDNIDTLVTNITTAASGNDWTSFDTYMQNFRDGQAKCYVMQDAARQITELSEASTSSCYMRRVDAETGDRLISYVSGDEVDQGAYFTPGAETAYRQLNLTGGGPGLQGGEEKIIFEIQGTDVEANVYQVSLNFCDTTTNTLRSTEVIRVDNTQGLLTVTSNRGGTDNYGGEEITYAHNIALSAALLQESDGTITFDPDAARTMTIQSSDSSDSFSFTSNGSLSVQDGNVTAKFRYKGNSTFQNQTFSFDEKSAAIVSYTGNNMSDIAIYEGAGSRQGTFTDPNQSDPFSFEDDIIFEYNENESPRYATATETDLSTALEAIDFSTDSILSQTTPEAPTSITDSSVCTQAVSSVYELDMSGAGMADVQTACEARFSDGDRICESIREVEDQIWSKLDQRNQAQ